MAQLVQSNTDEKSKNERVVGLLEQMSGKMEEIQLTAARAGKQPVLEGSTTDPNNNAPLLATPARPLLPTVGSSGHHGPKKTYPLQLVSPGEGESRITKVDVPVFMGDGFDAWLFHMERFFDHNQVYPDQRVHVASYYLGGDALHWFQYLKGAELVDTWPEFVAEMRDRFGTDRYFKPGVELNMLTQTATVAEYIAQFVSLVPSTTVLSRNNLLDRFLAGLNEEIRLELLKWEPKTLKFAIGLAKIA